MAAIHEGKDKTAEDMMARPPWRRIALWVVAVIVLINLVVGWYWSRTPDIFWVNQKSGGEGYVVGYATTDTLIRVAETLLDKPGGFLSNDRTPPSVFLDNMPNWEFGVLQQVRDLARVMRNDYSRSQSQSREDPDLAPAEAAFFVDHKSWILPRPESEYRTGIEGFRRYRDASRVLRPHHNGPLSWQTRDYSTLACGVVFEYTRYDAKGRLEGTGETFTVDADQVFKAIGQNFNDDLIPPGGLPGI